ncbi:MAG: carotenoid biosynthesis protein [Ignavibacteria bacterium]|nr:carotenoid biosynthesis protein [Ignavibacteria bacterium]
MEGQKNKLENALLITLYLMFIVGIFGHIFDSTRPIMLKLTPFSLLLFSLIVIYPDIGNKKILSWFIITFITTITIEIIGVKTGLIFGNYRYGDVLGLKVFDVPIIIGLNWTVIIFGAFNIALKISKNNFIIPILVGLLALIFDLALEPIAMKLNYWHWNNLSVPIQNYIAWFLIAVVFSIAFQIIKSFSKSNLSVNYYFIQLIFFTTLNIIL